MLILSVRIVDRHLFPLDEQWQFNRSVYSHEMAAQIVWLSALLPYEQCQAVLERIGERYIPSSSIWRQVQIHGERFERHVQAQREQVSVERVSCRMYAMTTRQLKWSQWMAAWSIFESKAGVS